MTTAPIRPPRHLLVRLQADWDHIKRSRRALQQASSWALSPDGEVGPITSLDDVLASAGYGGTAVGFDEGDRRLAELVRLAATDELAARIVLQRLLPGISSLARRRSNGTYARSEVLDEVMASAWTVIRTYPVDRRSSFVAAGLLREIDYQSFRRTHRRLTTFIPRPAETFDAHPAPDLERTAADELRELLDDAAAAGLDEADLDLARRLGRGESTASIAAATDVTDRTVRNKRSALTYRLRAVALAS